MHEKWDLTGLSDRLDIEVSSRPVWRLPVDMAIMAQDVNRVVGPIDPGPLPDDPSGEMKKVIRQLETFDPHKLGEVLVSKREWCLASRLVEAVIYHFEAEPVTRPEIVKYALESSFEKLTESRVSTLAMNPLGTEYGVVPFAAFVVLLADAYDKYRDHLSHLTRIILVPRHTSQVEPLKQAVQHVLGVQC